MKVLPGSPHPLGASWDGEGVNFALYSENATAVELCLFDEDGAETRVPLPHLTAFVWHAYVLGIGPTATYDRRSSSSAALRAASSSTRASTGKAIPARERRCTAR